MPFSSSNTGSTDFRDTDVQHPNTAATLSTLSSARAFSANSGQLEAGSTTTGSSLRPSSPPLAFCWAISISMTSFSVVSLIAIVPESECRMPTLIGVPASGVGAADAAGTVPGRARKPVAAAARPAPSRPRLLRPKAIRSDVIRNVPRTSIGRAGVGRARTQEHVACQDQQRAKSPAKWLEATIRGRIAPSTPRK